MEILILVQDYPNANNKYAMNYVHTRNLEYAQQNLNITVLSFSAQQSYYYEGIKVIPLENFKTEYRNHLFNLVISHAPNLRNHIRFLKEYNPRFGKILFFIHGHEVMRMAKYYPKTYSYLGTNHIKDFTRDLYDILKLKILKKYITSMFKNQKLKIIFVSNWMRDVFLENIPINKQLLLDNSYVISNAMNTIFLEQSYKLEQPIKADFITIRPLDNSKYAVDLVVELAKKHPSLTFHIYGKGEYFTYNEKPKNIEVFQEFFSPNDMAKLLNHYRCALLPTRLDAQGVLMCEVATYGMPLVTSNLPICKEMLYNFDNIFYFNNSEVEINLNEVLEGISLSKLSNEKNSRFSKGNTTIKELEIIKKIIEA
ncbi:glycosyltransferase family 4 protein [Neobacillus sp. MM2021_6]|uniref:glycosyltransferase family 4 protein n=1 Tax=Bacillaceae TaxID=186817 RepID=UPI00140AD6EA|nr:MULTISPECIES: glycosyltransferase family 4 protein [Bacillaceae]MBO0961641.1 glycosyltransferase family 4 protein [Neobacillus sp. MM2021_6]NHC21249.1 glycosyltransferase family 4 protein [Bacillus sp. MM2020_4]